MPIYEYQCSTCGYRFETIQRFSDSPVEKCPSCGQAAERLLSAPAIQFKGSGWYITDYAKKNSPTSSNTSTETSEKKDFVLPSNKNTPPQSTA